MDKDTADIIANLAKVAAIFIGGGYFLWRAIAGEFLPTLAVSMSCARPCIAQNKILVSVLLKKGSRGSMSLIGVILRARSLSGDFVETSELDVSRVATKTSDAHTKPETKPELDKHTDPKRPYLNLNDGDECSFQWVFLVSPDKDIYIDLIVLGRETDLADIRESKLSQWRSSCVSLANASASVVDRGSP